MIIRQANLNDLKSVTNSFIEFKEELIRFRPKYQESLRKKSFSSIQSFVKMEIENKDGLFLIAEDKGELAGFAYGTIQEYQHAVFEGIIYGKLNHIWVKSNYRKNGLSLKFKEQLFNWFQKNNCKYIEIIVLENNPAKEIYEKWGFETALGIMRKII